RELFTIIENILYVCCSQIAYVHR
ncbi:hypothetical protein KGM_205962B, partial [Danaus plexippus plexippus]